MRLSFRVFVFALDLKEWIPWTFLSFLQWNLILCAWTLETPTGNSNSENLKIAISVSASLKVLRKHHHHSLFQTADRQTSQQLEETFSAPCAQNKLLGKGQNMLRYSYHTPFFFVVSLSVCWRKPSVKESEGGQEICSSSSGKPVEPTEIYPGTKCNAVPLTDFCLRPECVCAPVYC